MGEMGVVGCIKTTTINWQWVSEGLLTIADSECELIIVGGVEVISKW